MTTAPDRIDLGGGLTLNRDTTADDIAADLNAGHDPDEGRAFETELAAMSPTDAARARTERNGWDTADPWRNLAPDAAAVVRALNGQAPGQPLDVLDVMHAAELAARGATVDVCDHLAVDDETFAAITSTWTTEDRHAASVERNRRRHAADPDFGARPPLVLPESAGSLFGRWVRRAAGR